RRTTGAPHAGNRPSPDRLRGLKARADHAAQAVRDARAAAESPRHRAALGQLLRVSARLTESLSVETTLSSLCEGIREALGFQNVSVELIDQATGRAVPKAAVGWSVEEIDDS